MKPSLHIYIINCRYIDIKEQVSQSLTNTARPATLAKRHHDSVTTMSLTKVC